MSATASSSTAQDHKNALAASIIIPLFLAYKVIYATPTIVEVEHINCTSIHVCTIIHTHHPSSGFSIWGTLSLYFHYLCCWFRYRVKRRGVIHGDHPTNPYPRLFSALFGSGTAKACQGRVVYSPNPHLPTRCSTAVLYRCILRWDLIPLFTPSVGSCILSTGWLYTQLMLAGWVHFAALVACIYITSLLHGFFRKKAPNVSSPPAPFRMLFACSLLTLGVDSHRL